MRSECSDPENSGKRNGDESDRKVCERQLQDFSDDSSIPLLNANQLKNKFIFALHFWGDYSDEKVLKF